MTALIRVSSLYPSLDKPSILIGRTRASQKEALLHIIDPDLGAHKRSFSENKTFFPKK
ncbi:hypothetical protein TRIP_B200421 [uncultured Desulfatiglans sp.]|nr:hypothetical protein TRIP_B200421 [uncultured Desulfatiglans sp.]